MIKRWSKKEVEFLECNYPNLTIKELAVKLNRAEKSVSRKIESSAKMIARSRKVRAMREYTMYKGDTVLAKGTLKEISHEMNMTMNRLHSLKSPAIIKRDKGNATVLLLNEGGC